MHWIFVVWKKNHFQIRHQIYFRYKINFVHFEQNELMENLFIFNDNVELRLSSANIKLKLLRRIFNSFLRTKSQKNVSQNKNCLSSLILFFNLKKVIMKSNDFRFV